MKPVKAWVVVHETGKIDIDTRMAIYDTREAADHYARRRTCCNPKVVRVEIRELKPKKER